MNFVLRNDFVYYVSKEKIRRLCISSIMKKIIYQMTHDNNHHCAFHRAYARIFESFYIRHMFKRLRRYIHHCKFYLKEQTKRHSFYDELSFIKTIIFFSYDDHRFYRDSFRVSRIRRYVNDNEQVFQKNQFNRRQRNMKRIKMSINMIRISAKRKLKNISRDHIRSRFKISQCFLNRNILLHENILTFNNCISLICRLIIEENESNNWDRHEIRFNEKERLRQINIIDLSHMK